VKEEEDDRDDLDDNDNDDDLTTVDSYPQNKKKLTDFTFAGGSDQNQVD